MTHIAATPFVVTTIDLCSPPITLKETKNMNIFTKYKEWKDKHVLEVELDGVSFEDESKDESYLNTLQLLSNYVLPDGKKLVDVVEVIAFTGLSFVQPTTVVYQGLKYFHPQHLMYLCGWDEHCDLTPLDNLEFTWPVKSLTIAGSCGDGLKTKYLQQITSLRLDFCCGTSLKFDGKCSLKNVIIIENDAINQFLELLPDIKTTIESLQIIGYNGCDHCEEYIVQGLRKCKNLTNLDFGHIKCIEDFPTHLPPNLTSLRFNGPPEAKKFFDLWIQCASDIEWLPKLTTFEYSLDARRDRSSIPCVNITPEVARDQAERAILGMIFITRSLLPKEIRRLIVHKMIVIQRTERLCSSMKDE